MLEDAVYYSRREADERALAAHTPNEDVRSIHLRLADKYSELARREMAGFDPSDVRTVAMGEVTFGAHRRPFR